MTAPEDGFLPGALRRLSDIVGDLIDPLPQLIGTKLHYADSRYAQLGQAIAGISRARSGGMGSLPIWPDAFDLLSEIDTSVNVWLPAPTLRTETRLQVLLESPWRPQDVDTLDKHSDDVSRWVTRIDGLLTDDHTMELLAPCPACGVRTVQRLRAGELVRVATLQVDANGCRCLDCHTEWAPQYFRQLARVIGCPPPAGILE